MVQELSKQALRNFCRADEATAMPLDDPGAVVAGVSQLRCSNSHHTGCRTI